MSRQTGIVDPNWRLGRDVLASDIMSSLQYISLVPTTRGSSVDGLDRWLESHTAGIRDTVCRHWCEGQRSGLSKAELAGAIADAIAQLNHVFPAATLSIYIVRFSGERLCRSRSDSTVSEEVDA
jgi:hypothetical protein